MSLITKQDCRLLNILKKEIGECNLYYKKYCNLKLQSKNDLITFVLGDDCGANDNNGKCICPLSKDIIQLIFDLCGQTLSDVTTVNEWQLILLNIRK